MSTTETPREVIYCNNCGTANLPRSVVCCSCGHVHARPIPLPDQAPTSKGKPSHSAIARAIAIYVGLWIPAVLVAALVTLAGLIAVFSAPMWSALSFLLAFPCVLVGLKSFRTSAISMVALLLWDIVATAWPDFNLGGFLHSLIDVLLLAATAIVVLVALASPFVSVLGFVRQTWPRRAGPSDIV